MTLLEIAVAIAIFAMIGMAISVVLHTTLMARERVQEIARGTEVIPAILNLMRRDIEAALDGGGDAAYFLGGPSELNFAASVSGYSPGPTEGTDRFENTMELGYKVVSGPEGGVLMRREQAFVDDEPTEGGVWSEVYDRVHRLEFEYSPDGRRWERGWDSREKQGLPRFIRIALEVGVTDPEASRERPAAWEMIVIPRP